ncbi:MAG: hypothetical protein ACE5HD_08150 [Acidobacteriota bacterium]
MCPGGWATLALLAVIVTFSCGPEEGETISVDRSMMLLPELEKASWTPRVINLNHPLIAPASVDLGDGPVPALFAHPDATVSWSLRLERRVRLVTAVGLRSGAWNLSGDGAGFTVRIGTNEPRVLYHRVLDPRHRPEDRGWKKVEIDLTPWTGQVIRLTLVTDTGGANDPSYDWAVWRNPTLEVVP